MRSLLNLEVLEPRETPVGVTPTNPLSEPSYALDGPKPLNPDGTPYIERPVPDGSPVATLPVIVIQWVSSRL